MCGCVCVDQRTDAGALSTSARRATNERRRRAARSIPARDKSNRATVTGDDFNVSHADEDEFLLRARDGDVESTLVVKSSPAASCRAGRRATAASMSRPCAIVVSDSTPRNISDWSIDL